MAAANGPDAHRPDGPADSRLPGEASAFRRALDAQAADDEASTALVPTGSHDLTAPISLEAIRAALGDPEATGLPPGGIPQQLGNTPGYFTGKVAASPTPPSRPSPDPMGSAVLTTGAAAAPEPSLFGPWRGEQQQPSRSTQAAQSQSAPSQSAQSQPAQPQPAQPQSAQSQPVQPQSAASMQSAQSAQSAQSMQSVQSAQPLQGPEVPQGPQIAPDARIAQPPQSMPAAQPMPGMQAGQASQIPQTAPAQQFTPTQQQIPAYEQTQVLSAQTAPPTQFTPPATFGQPDADPLTAPMPGPQIPTPQMSAPYTPTPQMSAPAAPPVTQAPPTVGPAGPGRDQPNAFNLPAAAPPYVPAAAPPFIPAAVPPRVPAGYNPMPGHNPPARHNPPPGQYLPERATPSSLPVKTGTRAAVVLDAGRSLLAHVGQGGHGENDSPRHDGGRGKAPRLGITVGVCVALASVAAFALVEMGNDDAAPPLGPTGLPSYAVPAAGSATGSGAAGAAASGSASPSASHARSASASHSASASPSASASASPSSSASSSSGSATKTATALVQAGTPPYWVGESGPGIAGIQARLASYRLLSYANGQYSVTRRTLEWLDFLTQSRVSAPAPDPSGTYGTATDDAIRAFEAEYLGESNPPATGCSAATYDSLMQVD